VPSGEPVRNGDGLIQQFWRGPNDAVWTSFQNLDNGTWSTPTSLGGIVFSEPAVGRDATGRLVVSAIGGEDMLYTIWETTAGSNTWGAWMPSGQRVRWASVHSDGNGALYLFTIATDNRVLYAVQSGAGTWGSWNHLALGYISTLLTVVRGPTGMLEVYGRNGGYSFQISQNADGSWPSAWVWIGRTQPAMPV
jgi:hypothetical protein